ncbi:hypothetical protein [Sphingomicrobium arenosum]|uniref:hypothetical protein n=1 Tax=Sphingomicrobium arenosum TaxID=2233861 RepID=UPI0022409308|nr:hypothetical protein [Sphingomicrobium arenosum]
MSRQANRLRSLKWSASVVALAGSAAVLPQQAAAEDYCYVYAGITNHYDCEDNGAPKSTAINFNGSGSSSPLILHLISPFEMSTSIPGNLITLTQTSGAVEVTQYSAGYGFGTGAGTYTATSGSALTVTASNGIDINMRNVSLSGSAYGMNLSNGASGQIDVEIGSVSGNAGAIRMQNSGPGGINADIFGSVNSLSGTGVFINDYGTGSVVMTIVGHVTGANGSGIEVRDSSTGDLRLDLIGDVFAGVNTGIWMVRTSSGQGNVVVDIAGDVTATNLYGIVAAAAAAGATGNIDVDVVGNVTARRVGITGEANVGNVDINVTGNVSVTEDLAINASTNDGDIFVDVNGNLEAFYSTLRATGTGGYVDVEVDNVTATNGEAVTLSSNGTGLEFDSSGLVTGEIGIDAGNLGAGNLTLTVNNVTGTAGDAIEATNAGGDLLITAAGTVTGAVRGIEAVQNGTGVTTINVGDVTGQSSGAIYVQSAGGTVSVTSTGQLTGAVNGIRVDQNGTGDTILALNNVAAQSGDGVAVFQNGAGAVDITTDGLVTGTNRGIYVDAAPAATDVTVLANAVSSGNYGIYVDHDGTGATTVTADGSITTTLAGTSDGIYVNTAATTTGDVNVTANGKITVAGDGDGIDAQHYGSGDLIITTAEMDVNRTGIFANVYNAGDIFITSNGLIEADIIGIHVNNFGTGDTNITVNEAINATGTGIYVDNDGGAVNILATETISGGFYSVGLDGGIKIDQSGDGVVDIDATSIVTTAGAGISIVNSGTGAVDIDLSGSIDAVGNGVYVYNSNTAQGGTDVTVAGTIDSTNGWGVYVRSVSPSDIDIDVLGTITAASGVYAYNSVGDSSVTTFIDTAAVDAIGNGIYAIQGYSGNIDIHATGDVTSSGGAGVTAWAAYHGAGQGNIDIQADGDVSTFGNGIWASAFDGYIDIDANGAVTSTNGLGIQAYTANGSVTVDADGAVSGTGGISASAASGGNVVVFARDTVSGTNGAGIATYNNGLGIDIDAATAVSGTTVGIYADQDGAGGIDIDALGTVSGGTYGIQTDNAGVGITDILTTQLVNGGFIGIQATSSGGGDILLNTGAVTGGSDAIQLVNNNGTSGDITATINGALSGGYDAGLYAENHGGASTIHARSTVSGRNGIVGWSGSSAVGDIQITADGAVTATDYGLGGVHNGLGDIAITAHDLVSATSYGIAAYHYGTGDIRIATDAVVATTSATGIQASSYGLGDITIIAGGTVTGNSGIDAVQGTAGGDITITAGDVFGLNYTGIAAYHFPSTAGGDITITATGDVVGGGTTGRGIVAAGWDAGTFFAINGSVDVTALGTVYGAEYGMVVGGLDGVTVTLGSDANLGASSDAAFLSAGGDTTVYNDGTVTGYMTFGAGNDTFYNGSALSVNLRNFADTDFNGVRDTEGVAINDFGAGTDLFVNEAGMVVRLLTVEDMAGFSAGTDDDTAPTTIDDTGALASTSVAAAGVEQAQFLGLETFENAGAIVMADALTGGTGPVAGDIIVITGSDTAGTDGEGVYLSNGGELYSDVDLATLEADMLMIDTAVLGTGATTIFLDFVGGASAVALDADDDGLFTDGEGLLLVNVLDMAGSDTGVFDLAAPIISDGVLYSLFEGSDGYYLSNIVGATDLGVCGAGTVTIDGTDSYTDVLGCSFNEAVTVEGDATVELIELAGGSDSVTVGGNASVGMINTSGAGQDDSADLDGADIVIVDTTGTVGAITTDLGDDGVSIANVTGLISVDLGAGDDVLVFTGGFTGTEALEGGEGDDSLALVEIEASADGDLITGFETVQISDESVIDMGGTLAAELYVLTGSTLTAMTGFGVDGDFYLDADSLLDASAGAFVTGDAFIDGTVTMIDGATDGLFAVDGTLNAGGTSVFGFDIELGTASADLVTADAFVGGATIELDLIGTATNGEDVLLIDTDSDLATGQFVLDGGAFRVGAYDYDLEAIEGDLFLASQIVAQASLYEALPHLMGLHAELPSYAERHGGQARMGDTGLWMRVDQQNDHFEPRASLTGFALDTAQLGGEIGFDAAMSENLAVSVWGELGRTSGEVSAVSGNGEIDSSHFGVGAAMTFASASGLYLDVQGRYRNVDVDVDSALLGEVADDLGRDLLVGSIEVGQRIALSGNWSLVPQAQLTYGGQQLGTIVGPDGETVAFTGDEQRLIGRFGLATELRQPVAGGDASMYLAADVIRDFNTDRSISLDVTDLGSEAVGTMGELSIGAAFAFGEGQRYRLWTQGGLRTGLDDSHAERLGTGLTVGFGARF